MQAPSSGRDIPPSSEAAAPAAAPAAKVDDAAKAAGADGAAKAILKAIGARGDPSVLAVFTLTTFLSAVLLFSVQPMFAKMVLPLLGGAPSVWAVALLFFQGALLAGYGYAHLLMRHVPLATTGFVHLALTALAFVALPISIPAGWSEPPLGDPYLWQLGLFAVAIGLPFVAVSANAPLLQAWFSRTGQRASGDPYFLYAASNLGSLIALLGYPFVLEPVFGLRALAGLWTGGFVALLAALGLCFWMVRRAGNAGAAAKGRAAEDKTGAAPTVRDRLRWVGLALVPSALLTAITTHIATDIASAPLIWVIPLSLYLLTFVIVFRERALISWPALLAIHLAAVVLALLQLAQTHHEKWYLTALLGVVAFFSSALVAHRTLYEARPAARHLTEFYMWMSLGGVLGGVFAALIAPKIFSEVFEYPLLLALTFACRPGALDISAKNRDEVLKLWLILAAGLLALFWVPWAVSKLGIGFGKWGVTPAIVLAFAIALMASWRHPVRQLAFACLMYLGVVILPSGVHRGEAQRSYFGVYRVIQSEDGEFNVLQHGTTLHGAQRIRDARGRTVASTTPATYYHPHSPMASSVRIVSTLLARQGGGGRYGVIGLGAGSMACHSSSGETWRFFEIDPVVVGIAKSAHFTYLVNCQPEADIVVGDARLTFAKETDESFDLVVVDAFSSDAIPVHLLTAEAIKLYADKLKPAGVGVLHISNRYLNLEAVLGSTIPTIAGLHAVVVENSQEEGYAKTGSTVVAFAKRMEALDAFRGLEGARELKASPLKPWTDDFSDILGPFRSQLKK